MSVEMLPQCEVAKLKQELKAPEATVPNSYHAWQVIPAGFFVHGVN